ncbi:MAG: UbiA family prenyltransferase [Verrucomicrobia bacterium]|nr:UbiA family prenyltransferase [Verrucomicrobiota bacterium]
MTDIRSWLILGRVSNLSTVWSNGLCAWILDGGEDTRLLVVMLAGLSLLYAGGMYLNDYCDVDFDRRFRPERPIPAGKVKRSTVLVAALGLFAAGLGCIAWAGTGPLFYALILLGVIVVYDLVHKDTVLGVPLMAACRTGVYLTIGAAGRGHINPLIWGASGLIFFYVLGVTALARTESTSLKESAAGCAFLIIPMIGTLYLAGPPFEDLFPISYCMAALWLAWTFSRARKSGKLILGKTIGPLLAGICLIDLAILNSMHLVSFPVMGLFLAFFLLALIAQRYVPAT